MVALDWNSPISVLLVVHRPVGLEAEEEAVQEQMIRRLEVVDRVVVGPEAWELLVLLEQLIREVAVVAQPAREARAVPELLSSGILRPLYQLQFALCALLARAQQRK